MVRLSINLAAAGISADVVEAMLDHEKDFVVELTDKRIVIEACEKTHDDVDALLGEHPELDYVLTA